MGITWATYTNVQSRLERLSGDGINISPAGRGDTMHVYMDPERYPTFYASNGVHIEGLEQAVTFAEGVQWALDMLHANPRAFPGRGDDGN